jgi:hypothetical protein
LENDGDVAASQVLKRFRRHRQHVASFEEDLA